MACHHGKHDDQADSTSQFLHWYGERLLGVGAEEVVTYDDRVNISVI